VKGEVVKKEKKNAGEGRGDLKKRKKKTISNKRKVRKKDESSGSK